MNNLTKKVIDDELYINYKTYTSKHFMDTKWHKILTFEKIENGIGGTGRAYTKEEFLNKLNTDDEFVKQWGNLKK